MRRNRSSIDGVKVAWIMRLAAAQGQTTKLLAQARNCLHLRGKTQC